MASAPRTFADLGLSTTSTAGLSALGFELMTPVQGLFLNFEQVFDAINSMIINFHVMLHNI